MGRILGIQFVAVALVYLAGAGWLYAGEEAPKTGLAALVDTVPDADKAGRNPGTLTAPDLETMKKTYDEIAKGGKQSVAALVNMLVEPGKGDDYKARYVLHGLVTYAGRPENEDLRPVVREGLLSTLGGNTPKGVQKYVLEELKHIGSTADAAAIGAFLADDDLCEFAAQALVAMRDASGIFRKALPAANGKNKLTVIQALGVLRDTQAADELKKSLSGTAPDIRLAAAEALANIGEASAADALLDAADGAKDFERIKLTEAALRLAQRLVESDKKKDAERIYSKLWDTRTAAEERQVRCAAVQGLAVVRGDIADILTAMRTNDPQIRAVAIRAAITMLGDDATKRIVEALPKAGPADRAALLAILGARRDPAALAAVLSLLKDAEEQVRLGALQAASAIGGAAAAEALVPLVGTAAGNERNAVLDALANMRGNQANAIVGAAAKPGADAAVRAALLGVLASRHAEDQVEAAMTALADQDKPLRLAALKALGVLAGDGQIPTLIKLVKETTDNEEFSAAEGALAGTAARRGDASAQQLSAALADAAPRSAAAMIRALGVSGTPAALKAVSEQTKNANADVKDAAVHVLSEWREKNAVAPLLELAQTAEKQEHQILALRGVVRLLDKDMKDPEKLTVLEGVLKAAKRPEEKRLALGKLQDIQTLRSFELVAPCLDDDAVKDEAAAALVKIAKKNPKSNADAIREALEKAAKVTTKNDVRSEAEGILTQIKK
ncbi:MAG: HEAT repeat domain-containing protein [Planctomycetota bacterium]